VAAGRRRKGGFVDLTEPRFFKSKIRQRKDCKQQNNVITKSLPENDRHSTDNCKWLPLLRVLNVLINLLDFKPVSDSQTYLSSSSQLKCSQSHLLPSANSSTATLRHCSKVLKQQIVPRFPSGCFKYLCFQMRK
jgi:hypothetical protein